MNFKNKNFAKIKLLLMLLITNTILISCTKEDNDEIITNATTANITVLDVNNEVAAGIQVYAYTNDTWTIVGDKPHFAEETEMTDNRGSAFFLLDNIPNIFVFDSQEIIHFSVHYTLNGLEKTNYTSMTFSEGYDKSATIIMD
jgi:hypothetical protein